MLKNEKEKYNITDEQKNCFIEIRNYYRDAFEEIDDDKNFVMTNDNLSLKKCKYDELIDFMCMKHNFDVERIQQHVNRLVEYNKKMGVTLENNTKTHKILIPKSKNYLLNALSSDIEFISSDDDTNDSENNEPIPSKKTADKNNIVKLLTTKLKTNSNKNNSNKTNSNKNNSNKTNSNKNNSNKNNSNKNNSNKNNSNKTNSNKTNSNKTNSNKTNSNKNNDNSEDMSISDFEEKSQ